MCVVVLLGVSVFACLVGYSLWAGEVVEDSVNAGDVPDVTPKPAFDPAATPHIPVKNVRVEGDTSFSFNGIVKNTVIQKTFVVSNVGDLPVSVTAKAVYTESAVISCSWDKTSAGLAVGESVTFKLTLLVSGDGACVVSFFKS